MEVWIDAQLPPSLAVTLRSEFSVDARHVLDLGLVSASDVEIFSKAKRADAIVITKDLDFVRMLETKGPPPRILWLTVGNLRNRDLWTIVAKNWRQAMAHFDAGEALVELGRSP